MFVGHLQRSVYCQNGENQIPLWGLFVAVQLLDFLWAPLFFLGLEKARIVPGITAVSPLDHREAAKQKKRRWKCLFVFHLIRTILRAYWITLLTSLRGRSSGGRRSLVV